MKAKTKKKIFLAIFIINSLAYTNAQENDKYSDVDPFINSGSMIDAMTALKNLEKNHREDTLDGEYWYRFSKASDAFYKYEQAKAAINRAIVLSPGKAEYFFEKGLLHNKSGELTSSFAAFDKAIALDPLGKYYYWRGIVNQQLVKNTAAEADYQTALEKKFESPELYNNYAIVLVEHEKYDKALEMINKAILFNPKYAQAYSARSKINFHLLNIDSACIDRQRAKSLGYKKTFEIPDSVCRGKAIQQLQYAADIFAANKLYAPAIKAYSKLINNKAVKSDYHLNRGYCYYLLGEFENAEKDYLQALNMPNAAKDLLFDNLSILYYEQRDYLKSIEYSTKRIELNPLNHVPYIDRGLCYRKLKKYKEAEKDFNKSLEVKPDFFRAFGYRSFLFLELGKYNKSYDDANRAVQINPKYGYGYIVLAQAKQKLGIPDYCLDLYKAKALNEPDADVGIEEFCK